MKGTKTGGRQKGTPNKATSTVRAWIVDLINENREQIAADLQSIEPGKRLDIVLQLLKFILPQNPSATDVRGAAYDIGDAVVVGTDLLSGIDNCRVVQWYERPPEDVAD